MQCDIWSSVGGGYGIVNEGRQVIKGDVPDPEQAAIGALYQVGSVLTFGACPITTMDTTSL